MLKVEVEVENLRKSLIFFLSRIIEDVTTKSRTRADKYRAAISKSSNIENEEEKIEQSKLDY